MTSGVADLTLLEGSAAPPRSNGELLFTAPWESQAFGLALALHEAGAFEWEAFRSRLIVEISEWETLGRAEPWSYYQRWLAALERTLADTGVLPLDDIDRRASLIAETEHQHGDHAHPDDHHH